MARRRKPEEPVQAPAEVEVVETFPAKEPEPGPEPAPEPERKAPKEPVLGYMRDFYGYF